MKLKKLFRYAAACFVAALVFVCFSGFTLTGSAKIKYSGKGTATISVISEEDERAFEESVKAYIDGFAVCSGESDMISLKDISETDGGYNVEVSFRRIDKVKAMGEFFLQKTSVFVPETSETGERIRNWEAGMFACTETIYYKSVAKSVNIDVTTIADGLRLYAANGTAVTLDELDSYAAGASDKSTVAAFNLLDVGCIESLTVSFPADIVYYAGGDMKLINKNTVEMRPVLIEAEITSTEGEMIPETKDIGAIFGYVIYEKGLSPVAIAGIIAGAAILGGLIAVFIVYLVKLGKNAAYAESSAACVTGNTGGAASPAATSAASGTYAKTLPEIAPARAIESARPEQAIAVPVKEQSAMFPAKARVFKRAFYFARKVV